MKSIQIKGYSKTIKTEIKEIPLPEITENEVLVRVKTAGANPLDNRLSKGR